MNNPLVFLNINGAEFLAYLIGRRHGLYEILLDGALDTVLVPEIQRIDWT